MSHDDLEGLKHQIHSKINKPITEVEDEVGKGEDDEAGCYI